ncbi:MAG: CAP domain-containing protein [Hyphomicrobiales bacterium]|nr:CAP domain-containing protein [Hyphomicrobiales bacterium]MCP4999468.1 CAP domain-containing protein [Hyphomicrobiales bacterium]
MVRGTDGAAILRIAVAILAAALLMMPAGCSMIGGSNAKLTDVPVNRGAALSKINAYRSANGLPRLTLDPKLDVAARDMARLIGRKDSMNTRAHSARGLSGRLDRAGYATYAGAENLGAGYVSFDHALSGWKGSPDHDKNLLNKHVTRIGIARVKRPDGRYLNFWVLILARPVADGRPTI